MSFVEPTGDAARTQASSAVGHYAAKIIPYGTISRSHLSPTLNFLRLTPGLFEAQCERGVGFDGAAGWDVAGQKRNGENEQGGEKKHVQ